MSSCNLALSKQSKANTNTFPLVNVKRQENNTKKRNTEFVTIHCNNSNNDNNNAKVNHLGAKNRILLIKFCCENFTKKKKKKKKGFNFLGFFTQNSKRKDENKKRNV